MKRFARALVVSTLCILSLATSASAECAWVLWEDTTLAANKISTEPVRAFTTKPDCDRALAAALDSWPTSPGVIVRKDATSQEVYVTIGKSTHAYRYVCLPDTVDPRGPKGK